MASQAKLDYITRLQAKLVLMDQGICPPDVYNRTAKKHPNGIAENLLFGLDDNLNSTIGAKVAPQKAAHPTAFYATREEKIDKRVTRSRTKRDQATLFVSGADPPTKGYSPIILPSSPGVESIISFLSLDSTEQADNSRRDSGVKFNKPLRERQSCSPRSPHLYIGSSPGYNRDAMIARRSRSASPSKAEHARGRSIGCASLDPKRVKLRMTSNSREEHDRKMHTLQVNESSCNFMRPGGRSSASANAPGAQFTAVTVTRKKRSSPSEDAEREKKRARLQVVDLTGSDADEAEHQPDSSAKVHMGEVTVKQEKHLANQDRSPASSLTDIDDHAMAHLERSHTIHVHQGNPSSDPSSPPTGNSDPSFMNSSPPLPQRSIVATAAAHPTNVADYNHVVLNAATWDLRVYATAGKARARCQEYPVPVNHRKNKHRQKRNTCLSVGESIEIGHKMQLYILDGAHNCVMNVLMGNGVNEAGKAWGRQMGRQRILGPEREKMRKWVETEGFRENVANVLGDVDAGKTAAPCLWFKIKEAVAKLRRIEAEKSKSVEKNEDAEDVEMKDAK